jgi:hypothetical protein
MTSWQPNTVIPSEARDLPRQENALSQPGDPSLSLGMTDAGEKVKEPL